MKIIKNKQSAAMKTLTINLTEEAYHAIRQAIETNQGKSCSVTDWIETEFNENTDVMIEMLLADY